jgi:hypothetical protein
MANPGDPQLYRVTVSSGAGRLVFTDVMASTGDEAATKALVEYPGGRVGHVEPAPQKVEPGRARLTAAPGEKMVEIESLDPNAQPVAA